MVEPNLSGNVEEAGTARNTRQVLAIRLAQRERRLEMLPCLVAPLPSEQLIETRVAMDLGA